MCLVYYRYLHIGDLTSNTISHTILRFEQLAKEHSTFYTTEIVTLRLMMFIRTN